MGRDLAEQNTDLLADSENIARGLDSALERDDTASGRTFTDGLFAHFIRAALGESMSAVMSLGRTLSRVYTRHRLDEMKEQRAFLAGRIYAMLEVCDALDRRKVSVEQVLALAGSKYSASIVSALEEFGAMTAGDLAKRVSISPTDLSRVARDLKGHGIVSVQRQGRCHYHDLTSTGRMLARQLQPTWLQTISFCIYETLRAHDEGVDYRNLVNSIQRHTLHEDATSEAIVWAIIVPFHEWASRETRVRNIHQYLAPQIEGVEGEAQGLQLEGRFSIKVWRIVQEPEPELQEINVYGRRIPLWQPQGDIPSMLKERLRDIGWSQDSQNIRGGLTRSRRGRLYEKRNENS